MPSCAIFPGWPCTDSEIDLNIFRIARLPEKLGVRSCAGEDEKVLLLIKFIDQQKVPADMSFAMIVPFSGQFMVTKLRR